MAKNPQPISPRVPTLRKFYVFDPNVGNELGGTRVETEGEGENQVRYVMMHPTQAKYWTDIMALGSEPFHKLHADTKTQLHRMWGGRLMKDAPGSTDEDAVPVPETPRKRKAARR